MAFSVVGAPDRFADIARAMGEPIDGLSPYASGRRSGYCR